MSHSDSASALAFIPRWRESGTAERANYALFLTELCDLLDVPRPEPTRPDDAGNAYVFERAVTFRHPDGSTSSGRIDLYRRGCFVLEAKQGASVAKLPTGEDHGDILLTAEAAPGTAKRPKKGTATRGTAAWDTAMLAARGQAEGYARALPASEGRPPFLLIVDVGHSIELYAEFTRSGATYTPFPDPQSYRLTLDDLARPEVRETLRAVWLDPLSLDPTRRSARVTREIAARLSMPAANSLMAWRGSGRTRCGRRRRRTRSIMKRTSPRCRSGWGTRTLPPPSCMTAAGRGPRTAPPSRWPIEHD